MAKTEKKTVIPKSLEELQSNIEKEFGSGSIMRGRGSVVKVDSFSTGVATIDRALGCGGLPLGRIIEFFGGESSGKTTTCFQFISACQKAVMPNKERNGVAAFIDAEHAFDPLWAERVGVDMDKLLISQPDSGEEGLSITETLVESGLVDLVVVDSVAALTPKSILDGEIGDANMAALAQLMSKAMGRLKGICSKNQASVIFINQIREKVGIVFGSPELTPGGRALKFYASVRMEIRKGSALKQSDEVVGFRPVIKVIKNKVAPPFRTAEYDICVGAKSRQIYGIDTVSSLIEVACGFGIIKRSGSFYSFDNAVLGNGLTKAAEALRSNPELLETIKSKTYLEICVITPDDEAASLAGQFEDV